MVAAKYLSTTGGAVQERSASQTSAGAGDGGKIVALTDAGVIDGSMLIKRKVAPTIAATYTLDVTAVDLYVIGVTATPQNANITNFTTTGTLKDGWPILVRILGDATPRTIAWDSAKFGVSGDIGSLPTATLASKSLLLGFIGDTNVGKLMLMAMDSIGY